MADRHASPLMVADWEDHQQCIVAWPGRHPVWDPYLRDAEYEYRDLVDLIMKFEEVLVVVQPKYRSDTLTDISTRARTIEIPFTESWIRDIGPVFVHCEDGLAGVDFRFNGWGHKFGDARSDDAFARRLCAALSVPVTSAPVVLEGGGICSDGEGTVIATEESVLNSNRNGDLSRSAMSQILQRYLGARRVIWIPYGLIGDTDTDGHVDNVVCFIRPGFVICQLVTNRSDPNYQRLLDNHHVLSNAVDAAGRRIEVVEFVDLPYVDLGTPRGLRPSSYLNVYIANGAVIVPVAEARTDESAIAALSEIFANRRVIPAKARHLAHGGGGIHCVTLGHPVQRSVTSEVTTGM